MSAIKTEKQHLVHLRNDIGYRLVTQKANIKYWQKMSEKEKVNSQAKVDCFEKRRIAKKAVKEDLIFIKCIDKLLNKSY